MSIPSDPGAEGADVPLSPSDGVVAAPAADGQAGDGIGGGSEFADGGVADGAGAGAAPGAIPLPAPATSDITVAEASFVEFPLTFVGASLATETDETGMTVTTSVTVVAGVAVLVEPEPSGPMPVIAPQEGPTPGQSDGEGGGRAGRRVRRSRRRRWWLWGSVTAVVAVALVAAGLVSAQRINRPLHAPASASALPASLVVSGTGPALPWPTKGQGAVAVPSLGFASQSGAETPVPIASLTKMTTALVVLTDHPVPAGESGPPITVIAPDIAEYQIEVHNDQSTVPIRLGEVLTERQMLEAMLTQSANDIAFTLAVWDAGSTEAFVAKMNAIALEIGATNTHYVDVSGYNPGSVSSASDCIRVAAAGMAIPTFAEVVGMSSVTLPLEGTVPNVVSEVGSTIGGYKVVGVKSGYTSEAKGCLVLAADRVISGRSVLVLTAVLTQPVPPPIIPTTTTTRPKPAPTTTKAPPPVPGSPPTTTPPTTAPPATAPPTTTTTIPLNDLQVPDPLRYTRPVTEALLTATAAAVVPVVTATAGQPAGTVTAQWGGVSHRVGVVAARGAWLAAWPGQQVHITTTLSPVPPGGRTGRKVGSASYALGTQVEVVPLRLAATVPEPTWWWRLVHN